MRQALGRFVVTDPKVCHGRPTFRGTRILVDDVLNDVSRGLAWETIIERWHNSITKDAISEAVRLANAAFVGETDQFASSVAE